jgi:hypothetical protein
MTQATSVSAIESIGLNPAAAKSILEILTQVGERAIVAAITAIAAKATAAVARAAYVATLAAIVLVATTVPTAGPHEEIVQLGDGTEIIVTINNDTGDHSAKYVAADGTQTVIGLRGAEQGGYIVTGGYNVLTNGERQDLNSAELNQMVSAVTTAGYIVYNQSDSGEENKAGNKGEGAKTKVGGTTATVDDEADEIFDPGAMEDEKPENEAEADAVRDAVRNDEGTIEISAEDLGDPAHKDKHDKMRVDKGDLRIHYYRDKDTGATFHGKIKQRFNK